MLEAMYSAETMATPRASERGRLRLGLRTSPAVKVTLFQESEENRAPTMATPTSRTESKFQPAWRQKSVKLLADRKSTRLNSSHANISYAVFCLKKNITCT